MLSHVVAYICVAVTIAAALVMFRKNNVGLGMFYLLFPVFYTVFLVYDRGFMSRQQVVSAMAIYGVITFVLVMYRWAMGGKRSANPSRPQ